MIERRTSRCCTAVAGCQHRAAPRGVDFLTIPDAYYKTVWNRVNKMLTEHGHQIVKEDHTRVKDLDLGGCGP